MSVAIVKGRVSNEELRKYQSNLTTGLSIWVGDKKTDEESFVELHILEREATITESQFDEISKLMLANDCVHAVKQMKKKIFGNER